MNSKTQIYFDPNDLHLGYIDSDGNPQHVLTDAFIKDGTIRVNNGYLEYKDAQGVWHTVIDENGNPAYLTGPLGPVGDTGNTGPQGQLGVEGSKYVIAAGATDLNFNEDAIEMIRECGFRPGDFSISTSGKIWVCNPDKKSFTSTVSIKGEDGVDGSTPQIGADGYWYIGGNKTDTKALGPKGDNGDGITAEDAFAIKVLTTHGKLSLGKMASGDPVPVKLICEALPPGIYSIDAVLLRPVIVSEDLDKNGICFLIAAYWQSTNSAVQVVTPGQVFVNNSYNKVYAICASASNIISTCKLDPPSGLVYWDWSRLNDIVSLLDIAPIYSNIKINKSDYFSSANTSAIHTSTGATFYFNRVKNAPYYRHLLEEALQEGDYYLTFSENTAMCKCFLKPFNTTGWSDLTEVKWKEWFRINTMDAGRYDLYIIPYASMLYGFNIPDDEGVVPLHTGKSDYKYIKGVQLYKRTAEITNITDSDEVVTISYSPAPGRPITRILLQKNGQPGKDGITPHIGENGNWFLGEEDTSVKAQGELGPQGETGAAGIDGNTPQLKVEDGFWKVSYDNGDNWEQIAEYVGKLDLNTVNQELSKVSLNVRTLSALTQGHESNLTDINNLLFQGGDWFEDMEELSPEITGFDMEYSDIPHYVMYHNNILLKNINYESGELPEGESYPLYGEHEGYGDPAYITYNLYGDYCTVSVSNLLLINGLADIYFRLPVEPVEETNTTFMAREGSDYQLVCCTVGHHDYSYTGITEPVLWFRPYEADTYNTDYHISLTITYKYRNNEDF